MLQQIPESMLDCYAAHMGMWHVEPTWFNQAFAAIKTGMLAPESVDEQRQRQARMQGFELLDGGIALVTLHGHMTKRGDSFGGGSTIRTRKALWAAGNDSAVLRIVLHIDSPGGHVAGTDELARAVREVGKIKPVDVFADDCCASAAYYVASQARSITANEGAEIGSIGTLLIVQDLSRMAEMAGIEVHVLSTGAFKGAGVPGSEITEEHLAYFQERVDSLNELFIRAVQGGRNMSTARLRPVADGRVFIAAEAQRLGLIDCVAPWDVALATMQQEQREGGATMPAQEILQTVLQGLGRKGKVVISEDVESAPETTLTVEAMASLAEAIGVPVAALAHAVEALDFEALQAVHTEALTEVAQAAYEKGLAQGGQDGAEGAKKAGMTAGVIVGRREAAEIANHCYVAECPDQTHTYLAEHEDGSFMSMSVVRTAVGTIREQAQSVAEITSSIVPRAPEEPESEEVKDVYAARNAHLPGY